MSEPYIVKPDREFLDRVLHEGGGDLKKCFQCATCSMVCELSTGPTPFPRKEMIWAQWGLKDRLMADPDVWLCHQCNDCSTQCPRGARPGDVLGAVRQECVEHYAIPKFFGRLANRVEMLPLLLLAPIVILLLALAARGSIEGIVPLQGILHFLDHDPEAFYGRFFPHWMLIGVFTTFTCLAALVMLISVVRFWKAMMAADKASNGYTPTAGIIPSSISTLVSIVTHDRFVKCGDQASRRLTHLLAFYGFLALFVVTIWAVLDLYLMPFISSSFPMYPFNLVHPMKIVANIGCALLIFGCVRAIANRMNNQEESAKSTTFDWVFVWLLLGVAVSGLLTEILRFALEPAVPTTQITGAAHIANAVYFVHLLLVFDLLVYLPYSKFAHIVYRTVALVYAEHTGRNRKPLAASQ